LPELVLAGEMMNQIMELVKPKLAGVQEVKRHGKVVIGTVEGDIHDIGKDIVAFMLDANGFEVLDLGVDVPSQKFVDAIQDFQPQVVGLSGFLTLAFDAMKDTVAAIESAGLRDKVKIMIGGGQVNEEINEYAGADGYGKDAMAGVSLAKKWVDRK
jgi:methanogenic corrinoid protein MtbC1